MKKEGRKEGNKDGWKEGEKQGRREERREGRREGRKEGRKAVNAVNYPATYRNAKQWVPAKIVGLRCLCCLAACKTSCAAVVRESTHP